MDAASRRAGSAGRIRKVGSGGAGAPVSPAPLVVPPPTRAKQLLAAGLVAAGLVAAGCWACPSITRGGDTSSLMELPHIRDGLLTMPDGATRSRWAARWALVVIGYVVVGGLILGRAALDLGGTVPGAARSDVWNSLWSLWFVSDALAEGQLPWHTLHLNHPSGGVLMVADPVGAVVAALPVQWLGVEATYGLLVWGRIVAAGLAAHLVAHELMRGSSPGQPGWAPWVAGLGYCTSAVLMSGIHNGTSEAAAFAPAGLACWAAARAVRLGSWGWASLGGLLLVWSTAASGYSAVVSYLLVGMLVISWFPVAPKHWGKRATVLLVGLAGSLPIAAGISRAAVFKGNLVGIKHPAELASVRRSTGPADPLAYLIPGDYRSPDFRIISRYGEDFIHSPYLGWTLLLVAAFGLYTHRRELRDVGWLLAGGAVCGLLSLGPVIVHDGLAWVFLDERVWPLPYLMLERVPGLGSLSLLWRLGQGAALAIAVVAAWALRGRSVGVVGLVAALVFLESRLVAPTAGLPVHTEARTHPVFDALRDAPAGAVVNYPVVGGRAYLHEQAIHQMPIAGRLNFPNNGIGRSFWTTVRRSLAVDDGDARRDIRAKAIETGIRYIILHEDPEAGPGMYDEAVELAEELFPAMGESEPRATSGPHSQGVRVLRLY